MQETKQVKISRFPQLADLSYDILQIVGKQSMNHIWIYGSQARGQHTTDSDIDLLVIDNMFTYKKLCERRNWLCVKYSIYIEIQFMLKQTLDTKYIAFHQDIKRQMMQVSNFLPCYVNSSGK